MSRGGSGTKGRRRLRRRRPFLVSFVPLAVATLAASNPSQEGRAPEAADSLPPAAHILDRQVRITHATTGELRVIEFLRLVPPISMSEEITTLPILRLQTIASGLQGISVGNLSGERVVRSQTGATLAGPLPEGLLEVGLEYRLPADATHLVLAAQLPVDDLLVLIDKGGIAARLDPRLEADGLEGSPVQPIARYRGTGLASGAEIVLRLGDAAVEWRERIAVFAAACLAAVIAYLAVAHRERRERSTPDG